MVFSVIKEAFSFSFSNIGAAFKMLLVPFVLAMFIFLMPRLYLTQDFPNYARVDVVNIEWNYGTFYAGMLPQFLYKMSWLWFLLGLFIDSIVNYPLLKGT